MHSRTFIIACVLLGILVFLALQRQSQPVVAPQAAEEKPAPKPVAAEHVVRQPTSKATDSPGATFLLEGYADPKRTIVDDLKLVDHVFREYQVAFRGNPVGTNAEIMARFQGHNSRKIVYVPEQHTYINAAGELLDRWSRPLFFHQQSSHLMEIRSAGPDGSHWTEDDIVFPPPEPEPPEKTP